MPKQSLAAIVNDVEARLRRELAREVMDRLRSELYEDLLEVEDKEEKILDLEPCDDTRDLLRMQEVESG